MAIAANAIFFIKLSFNNTHAGSRLARKKAAGGTRQAQFVIGG
jgi:hypothetical protein